MTGDPLKDGRRTYRAIHARIGDCRDLQLSPAAARAVAKEAWSKAADREAFIAGWVGERERDLLERLRFSREAREMPEPFLPGINAMMPDDYRN